MSLDLPRAADGAVVRPAILVVDDDRRVFELLEIALEAHGYRVLHAGDGDTALECARRERPALVVLDVRLPRRSGYEVCERLRQDPDDPLVPILMVSAAAEVDARVQGLTRGADDYLVKPFSPKELVARVQRMVARAGEAREAKRAGHVAERELARAREEVERTQHALQRARRVAEWARALAAMLEGCVEPTEIADALLRAVLRATGVDSAVVLARDPADDARLTVLAAHGADRARLQGLTLRRRGELARLLGGLGRVVRHEELVRFAELREELPGLVIAGFAAVSAMGVEEDLEGALLMGERSDGAPLDAERMEEVAALSTVAARTLDRARRLRAPLEAAVELMAALAVANGSAPASHVSDEVEEVVERAAGALGLEQTLRRRVGWAVRLGPGMLEGVGAARLESAMRADPTGLLAKLRRLALAAHHRVPSPAADPDALPATLVALGWRAAGGIADGLPATLAWGRAVGEVAPAEPELPRLLRDALRARRRPHHAA